MRHEINPLLTSLYSGSITKEEFLKDYFTGKIQSDSYVLDLIEQGISTEEEITIDEAITLIYTGAFSYSCFTLKLCDLLKMPWHKRHEDIAMLLRDIADPSTVDCIYNATELQFQYLDYDDTYQFARKCVKALVAIGNENAIKKVKMLSNSKVHKITEYAKKELAQKGLL